MKKILVLLAALVLALPAVSLGEAAYFPVTLTDQAGREVVIEEAPKRLVSGYYISTSLLIALDLDDHLVGIEAKAKSRPIYSLSAPELIDLPSVGTAKEFDLEGCAALEPDLVILPLKLRKAADTLTNLGMNVILVNPENRELLADMMDLIGEATGTQARVQQLRDFSGVQETFLLETLAGVKAPRVYLAGNSDMLMTAGGSMYQSDMIRLAGGENVASDIQDSYWAQISYEQLLAWDPAYIILASDAGYTVSDVLSDPNLQACAAVRNGQVYQLPGHIESWDSPVPGGILGSLWLANVLHGDLITEEYFCRVMDTYYETFYGFTY